MLATSILGYSTSLLQLTSVGLLLTPGPDVGSIRLKMHPIEHQIVALTNAQRSRYGFQQLSIDPVLMSSARSHTAWMTRSRILRHTSRRVAENIAMGHRTTDMVVRAWMNSPGHRANLLGAGYTRIGVAAYTAPNGVIYWCQQFLP